METPENVHGGDRVHRRSRDLVDVVLSLFQLTSCQKIGASLILGIGGVRVQRLVLVTNKIRRLEAFETLAPCPHNRKYGKLRKRGISRGIAINE